MIYEATNILLTRIEGLKLLFKYNAPFRSCISNTIPLKYLSNFWRSFKLSLSSCEVELDLSWIKDFLLIEHNNNITGIYFKVANTKLYVPVVTLSINDNIKFLENLKQELKEQFLGISIDLK